MVSAIVLSYNRSVQVLYTIFKLKELKSSVPFALEIIVIDNGSADDTSVQIQKNHPDITLITKKENVGIAGWNEGFKLSQNKYFLVLDDDSHPESGLSGAISYMEEHDRVGILALNITGGNYETSEWVTNTDLIGFIGCGAIIRNEVYKKIGGFAEWLHVYAHEWEYGIRCIDAGYQIRFFKNSNVVHRSDAQRLFNKNTYVFSTRNEIGIVYKYFTKNRLRFMFRVWINSMKLSKTEGLKIFYYSCLGGLKFLQLKKKLVKTPVSYQTQVFFSNIFWGTRPVFDFVEKRLRPLIAKFKTPPAGR